MNSTITEKPKSKHPRKFAREPQGDPAVTTALTPESANDTAASAQPEPKPKSKVSLLLDLLARSEGATLEQMVAATGWLPHTTRAALTGLKKKGHAVTSARADGVRTYRLFKTNAEEVTPPAAIEANA